MEINDEEECLLISKEKDVLLVDDKDYEFLGELTTLELANLLEYAIYTDNYGLKTSIIDEIKLKNYYKQQLHSDLAIKKY